MPDMKKRNLTGPDLPTVFVIDGDERVRSGIQSLLASVGLTVAGYRSAREFLAAYDPARPGCLILETRLAGLGGLELQERLARAEVAPPVIVLTAHGDIPLAVQAMRNGAVDFLEKPVRPQTLLDRVHEALVRDAAQRRLHVLRGTLLARVGELTARERDVMAHLVRGLPSKVIAERLGATLKAVEGYRGRVMRKMRARNLPELVRMSLVLEYGVDVLTRSRGPRQRPAEAAALLEPDDLVYLASCPAKAARAAAEHVKLPGGVAAEGQHEAAEPSVGRAGDLELLE
jgi:FixJ family two-component response regulator